MNRIETFVYNLVKKNPKIKQGIRNLYQGLFDLLPRKKEYLSDGTVFRENYFFGFHDITPLSLDEKRLLALHNDFDFRMPTPKEGIQIGYFDFKDGTLGEWHEIATSYAWNYHKGCRLQWMDNDRIIFNSGIDGSLCSIILNLATKKSKEIPYPIDSVYIDENAELATSFSYERLERCMPGYGYPYKDNGQINDSAPSDSGLFLINLNTLDRKLLISLKDVAIAVTGKIENEYLHFVTHTEFSHDGRYISFLYRRIPKEGDYMKRRSVMCVYDLECERLIILPSQESGSHYVWNSRNQLIASVNIDGNNCHALFSPEDLKLSRPIAADKINSDGHQSFIEDSVFVTDTYPDKYRLANLYRVDTENDKVDLLAKVYSPKQFQTKDFHCHIACDLHPRVIGNGKWLCFDSARTGKRGIYIMPIGK